MSHFFALEHTYALINKTINSDAFKRKHRLTENSFTRTRSLPFATLVTYFLNLTKGSYQQELDNFFAVVNPDNPPSQVVTKSAITQARKNLSHTAFVDLDHQAVSSYYDNCLTVKKWRGYRLCAIDGSQIRMPDEPGIVDAFGVNPGKENQKECPLALVSVYYDVLNHISIDSSINHTKASERECAAMHLNISRPDDLSLLDRGYDAFWLYALYKARKRFFCMRAKINLGKQFKEFSDSGKLQTVITLSPNKKSIKQCKKKGLSTESLKLRLIRVELDGEVEVLVTNLMDEEAVPVHVFKELYHLRWGVEENYKRLKQWVEIENFSGKSALSVRQDFYAKMLTSNLTAMAANAAQKHVDKTISGRQHTYQINFSQALCKMKNTVVELLLFSAEKLRDRLEVLIDYMTCTIEPVRKGRSYLRGKSKTKTFHGNYKRAK